MRGRQALGDAALSTYKRVAPKEDQLDDYTHDGRLQGLGREGGNPPWSKSLPHVVVATIASFLFGYHLGVVNDTLESISIDLGFSGNTMAEGLVVSMSLGGAFIGSLFSGSIADYFGRKRSFQLGALPMIFGASMSAATSSLAGMLTGRFFVGTGMGLGPAVAALYVAEVSPTYVRGTFGSFTQIATCIGLMGSFVIGMPAKETKDWWRVCFWVSVIPAALLAISIELCAESPQWLFKKGRSIEAEAEFERLLGGLHVKSAVAELSKLDRGDETDTVKFSELFYGRHFKVVFIGSVLFALQQLSGINAVFYFSSSVFKSAGVPSDTANMFVAVVNLSGSCTATMLMDKLGRKVLLLGSFLGMCLPITLDVGTNNENLLNDEFYIGLRQKRATGEEYSEFVQEFMSAVKQNYGEKILIQFEDFANHNAFELLEKYRTTHLVFNDNIQGTASVVLAGLIASLKLLEGNLADHTFLFLGAGEAGTGIAELIALEMSKETNAPIEEMRKKIWLVDSKGLVVSSRKESLQSFKLPWAHEFEPVTTLLEAVQAIRPTVLIGTSGKGKTFTKEVVEAMSSINLKPLILALSNPTSQAECTAEEAYTWSKGNAIFASGSPFDPVEYEGNSFVPGQANNAYIFPGFGLGLIMCGAIRVHDDMLLAASEALASQVTEEHLAKGLIYPPYKDIRKISAHIAAKVAEKAYELGLASRLPQPENLFKFAESCMYSPVYRNFR